MINKLSSYIEEIERQLITRYNLREKAIDLAREIIRNCGEIISLSHRGELDNAVKKLEGIKTMIEELRNICNKFPELLFQGDIGIAFQEYTEAIAIISFYKGEEISSFKDIGVPDIFYILGLADFVGELRRAFLEYARKGNLVEAEKTLSLMDRIYELLWKLEYPKAMVPGLRQKIDSLRKILEQTRYDLFLAYKFKY
jgi:translin